MSIRKALSILKRFPQAGTVRRAGPEDLKSCAMLYCRMAQAEGIEITPAIASRAVQRIRECVKDPQYGVVFVLEEAGKIVGQVICGQIEGRLPDENGRLSVSGLWVEPEYRRPGASLGLIRAAIELAQDLDEPIEITVTPGRRTGLYERLGCKKESVTFTLAAVT